MRKFFFALGIIWITFCMLILAMEPRPVEGGFFIFALAPGVAAFLIGSLFSKNKNISKQYVITPENIRNHLLNFYNSYQDGVFMPQLVFKSIHPLGTATSIDVQSVAINWKNNTPSSREEDIRSLDYVLNLYWSTPITPDGYTRIYVTYDVINQQETATVLGTNGMTIGNLKRFAIGLGTEALKRWVFGG